MAEVKVRLKFGMVAGVLVALLALYSFVVAPRWLRVTRLRVGIPDLPNAFRGLRIAHLSDFHAGGPGVSLATLWQARAAALQFKPDLLALTGDYYDNGRFFEAGGLYADWPEQLPVLGTLGNHDWRGRADDFRRVTYELTAGGVHLLRNDAVEIMLRGRSAWVAGVDDAHTRRDDVEAALATVADGDDVLIALSHSPAVVDAVPPGRVALMLAGHTHGGQIRLQPSGKIPFIEQIRWLFGLKNRPDPHYFRGCHRVNGTILIISDGLGMSILPARLRTRPQVILIELVSAAESGPDCADIVRYVENISAEPRFLRWLT